MWFRRSGTKRAADAPRQRSGSEPSTDTVGNPILFRALGGPVPAAEPTITRAERRMLEFVSEERVDREQVRGGAPSWRVDGRAADRTKSMMLDWLYEQRCIAVGGPRLGALAVLATAEGLRLLDTD